MKACIAIFIVFICFAGHAQLPVSDFEVNTNVCRSQNLVFTNNSQNYSSLSWDFCEGDLLLEPSAEIVTFLASSFTPKDLDVVYDGSRYYALMVVRSSNELYRFNFGESILNTTPVIENLGNLGGQLLNPEQIELVQEGDGFYAFILNAQNLSLIRLDFGDNMQNDPGITNVYDGLGAFNGGMELTNSSDGWTLMLSDFANGVQVLPIGSDITNVPAANSHFAFTISGAAGLNGINVAKRNDNWYGFASALNTRSVYRIDFGTSLLNPMPNVVRLTDSSIGSDRPSVIQLVRDAGSEVLSVQLLGGEIQQWQLGSEITNDVETVVSLPPTENVFAIGANKLVKEESRWVSLVINQSKRFVLSVQFPDVCDATQSVSRDIEPEGISYGSSGNRFVGLRVRDNMGNEDYSATVVSVDDSAAPSAEFIVEGSCVDAPLRFLAIDSVAITSYLWDFGDGTTSIEKNPTHLYPAAGTYLSHVEVGASNGCTNSMTMSVNILEAPVTDFATPGGILCTNQEVVFTNTSITDPDLSSFSWSVDGIEVSNNRDLVYEFSSSGSFAISLKTAIPGCEDVKEEIVTVLEGPKPLFTFNNQCKDAPVTFINESEGQISTYSWDFGDGTNSNEISPVHTYTSSGVFNVVLSLTNLNGCLVTTEQEITIHALPIASFTNELECSNSPVRFFDQSTVDQANIVAWNWDFGVAGTSTEENPVIIFENPGDYSVELIASSEFSCRDTTRVDLFVRESPVASFDISGVCKDQTIQFTDTSTPSTGTDITDWAWDLGGTFSDQQNPTTEFDVAGNYDIILTVVASDQCFGSTTQTISVPTPVEVNFTDENTCAGQEAKFTDISLQEGQSIATRHWDFAGQATSTDSIAFHTFDSPGTYSVELMLVTEEGCVYLLRRDISVAAEPEVSFDATTLSGPPPLSVLFTNTTSNTDSLIWFVDDSPVGMESTLEYVFLQSGFFKVTLRVYTDSGCIGESSVTVRVSSEDMDLAVNTMRVDGTDVFIEVRNLGNIAVGSIPVVLITSEGESLFNISTDLPAGESEVILIPGEYPGEGDVCATIESEIEGFPDIDISNNSACILVDGRARISEPYPNPTRDNITLNLALIDPAVIDFQWVSSDGKQIEVPPIIVSSGFGRYMFDTSGLSRGVYYLKVDTESQTEIFRIVVE